MKQTIYTLILAALALTGCGKSSGGGGTAYTYYQNRNDGYCYRSQDNARVDSTNCNGDDYYLSTNGNCYKQNDGTTVDRNTYCGMGAASGNGYYYVNGNCYNANNRSNVVDGRYCSDQSYAQRRTCTGTYYYYQRYTRYSIDCSGGYCLGNAMYDGSGLFVYCQQ